MGKEPKKIVDSRGREMIAVSFRCPVNVFDALNTEGLKTDASMSMSIVRILKKYFNMK